MTTTDLHTLSLPALRLVLPLPPSVNGYWRSIPMNRKVRVLVSEEGRRFKVRCQLAGQMQRATPFDGDVSLVAVVYFRDGRRDLDNALKPLLDALQGVAYHDDRQVAHLDFRKATDRKNPRVELIVSELATGARLGGVVEVERFLKGEG